MKWFPIDNCPAWSYVTKTHFGTCIVDGRTITMRFKVELVAPTKVPDVLGIEEFCREMASEKATLEVYTAKLASHLRCRVTGKGHTATHGVIRCVIEG